MGFVSEWVRYGDGPIASYMCYPARAKTPIPAVVVLQEAWGVDAHIEDVTLRFARAGYAAIAPDLYAVKGERPAELTRERITEARTFLDAHPPTIWMDAAERAAALAPKPEAERARIEATFGAVMANVGDLGSFVPKIVATSRWLRETCPTTRGAKVGAVGYCMGGGLAGLLACHDPELAAAVVYYGRPPSADLVPNVRCPILGLYGGLDARINAQIPAFEAAMKEHGKSFEKVVYDGAPHAFDNDERPAYDVRAARDAFARTLALFRTALTL